MFLGFGFGFEVWGGVDWIWCFVCDLFVIVGLVLFELLILGLVIVVLGLYFVVLFGGF